MEFAVTHIEKVDLPNYLETTWAGKEATTKPAPLLAKYRVVIETAGQRCELLLEIRSGPHGVFRVDEYQEDGLFQAVMPLLASIPSGKRRRHFYNEAVRQMSESVAQFWIGEATAPPWKYELRDREDAQPRDQRDADDRAR